MNEKKEKRRISLKAACFVAFVAFVAGAAAAGGIGYAVSENRAKEAEPAEAADMGQSTLLPEEEKRTLSSDDAEKSADTLWDFGETERLRKYMDTALVPKFGLADLDGDARGLAGEKICDLDDDGGLELLVFLLKEKEIILRIFEPGEDGVYCAASHSWERPSETREFDLFWAVVRADDVTYLFFDDNYHGIARDFNFSNTGLYRYDGEKLYAPLEIKQTGSDSHPVMTAYQYDKGGELLSEEIIYDENDGINPESRLPRYYGRIGGLFYEYGFDLESEAALNGGRGGYHNLTKANGYSPLLQLNMWIEEQTDRPDVYHGNDLDNPLLTYRQFLYEEAAARIREGVWYAYDKDKNVDKDREWTFRDIMELVRGYFLEGSGRWPYVEYAYLDCGGDGVQELAVRFVGIGIDGSLDDSDLTMVLACHGGTLEVVYAGESWCRSVTKLYEHGFIYNYGSSGAMCQGFGGDYIDENGDVQSVYEAEQNSYTVWDMKVRLGYDNREEDYDSKYGATVTTYQIGDAEYSTLEFGEEASEQFCREYRDDLEEHTNLVTEEEINGLIGRRAAELGIQKEWMEEEDLAWSYCSW